MLTLTRSVGERILIGDDIVIEIRAVLDGKQVRISIDAPRQVPIHRAEVLEAVSEANIAAITSGPNPAAFARSVLAARKAAEDADGTSGDANEPPGPPARPRPRRADRG